jgi:hypothetical protein
MGAGGRRPDYASATATSEQYRRGSNPGSGAFTATGTSMASNYCVHSAAPF